MKRYLVELEAGEREALEAITRKGSHRSQKVLNALVLLNCDAGECNERRATGREIAGVLRISARRVDRVKKRFVEDGLEAALGARQGRRAKYLRKADGEFEARLVALSCGDPPEGRSQWSLRLLADRAVELGYIDTVSHETVRRVLKKNAVKPWRRIGWVIPPQRNADFAAGMERVLDVYRRPYDADFPVVCMDETPRQLIGETRTPVPPAPGRPAREDYEYRRLGTCNVFMATEPLAGRRQTKVTERRTKTDWARFLRDIAAQYPDATRITLVMDNLNTHRPGALYETFEPAEAKALWDRFEFVHTPTHGSWLNVAEVELNVMISASASTAASIPSTPCAPKSPPGRRPETESKRRSTGSSPRTTPVSSSSASIRRLMCDMTLGLGGCRDPPATGEPCLAGVARAPAGVSSSRTAFAHPGAPRVTNGNWPLRV